MLNLYLLSAAAVLVACLSYAAIRSTSTDISVWVIILSRRDALARRAAVRDLWRAASREKCRVSFQFLICRKPQPSLHLTTQLDEEREEFGDLGMLDCEEGYGKGRLVQKVLAGMKDFLSRSASSDSSCISISNCGTLDFEPQLGVAVATVRYVHP